MSKSILQDDGIKRCYISHERCGRNGEPLERHHIMNGSLRDFAEQFGLWIWITPELHRFLHDTGNGALIQKNVLKPLAQFYFEREYSHELWMNKVHKNYV